MIRCSHGRRAGGDRLVRLHANRGLGRHHRTGRRGHDQSTAELGVLTGCGLLPGWHPHWRHRPRSAAPADQDCRPGASSVDAELVAFGISHYGEVVVLVLFGTQMDPANGLQPRHLGIHLAPPCFGRHVTGRADPHIKVQPFLPAFGSGTRWNRIRGPCPDGSTTADQDSSLPPTASEKSCQLAYPAGGVSRT